MKKHRRVAVVTGAGSGIGRRTAILLLQEGYAVVLVGRRRKPLDETLAEAGAASGRGLVLPADVTDPAGVEALFARILQVYDRVDLLFNNAGVNVPAASLEKISFLQWKSVIDTNLTGAFLCTQAAFRIMKRQKPRGGRIINNGSISAHVPRPGSAPYTASKHAITGLTRATALDGRAHDIACGQIDIGNAATELTERMKRGVMQADGSIAVEPTIDSDHVARAVVYMANLPLDANVPFLTLMATKMPYIGRG